MPFENSITGGQGSLIRPAIKSPNYVTGVSGWTINRDGSAEFNDVTIRGNLVAGTITAGSIGSSNIVNSNFNGGTINQSTITFDNSGGVLLVYSTTTSTVTFNSGSSTWAAPGGVTSVQVQCWGAGGGGAYGNVGGTFGGGAGGGGEYAADMNVAVTAGNNYAYSVGAGGAGTDGGASGGNTTFTGNSVTVTAHGGSGLDQPGFTTQFGRPGGTGSSNSIHFDGGLGGSGAGGSAGSPFGGGGGGSSAGTSSSGVTGNNAFLGNGGVGATAPSGGGNGGGGGTVGLGGNGTVGAAPGGGGGGAANVGGNVAGAGANGRVTLTWTTARTLIASIAPQSGTDAFGNAYPQGISGVTYTANGLQVPIGYPATAGYYTGASSIAGSTGSEVAIPAATWTAEPNFTFINGHIYRLYVQFGFGVSAASQHWGLVKVRKGSATTSGQILGGIDVQVPSNTSFVSASFDKIIKNVSGSNITSALSLTMTRVSGAGTISLYGGLATSGFPDPLEIKLQDLGLESGHALSAMAVSIT